MGGAFGGPLGTAVTENFNSAMMLHAGATGRPGQLQAMVKEYQPITALIEKLAIPARRCDDSSCLVQRQLSDGGSGK